MNGRATPSRFVLIAVAFLIASAVLRLIPGYTTFTQTYDEPFHIAAGMEWLDRGAYHYEHQHPPLARVAVALGPYLKGIRSRLLPTATDEGNAILYSDGKYWQNLMLARLGALPFLVMACVVVYCWGSRWFGKAAGLWALLLFVNLPPILGHAGLATLDMACAATIAGALYGFVRWLETPDWKRTLGLAVLVSAAFLSKFSSFVFLPACVAVSCIYIAFAGRQSVAAAAQWKRAGLRIAGAVCVVFVLLWSGYRFTLRPVGAVIENPRLRERLCGAHPTLCAVSLPLTEIGHGLHQVLWHTDHGHGSYLLGSYGASGWWYFFPVVIGVKTPLAFLVLAIGGLAAVFWKMRRGPWQHVVTALFPTTILLLCLPSSINLGVRHILAIYPFLAVLAGHAMASAFQRRVAVKLGMGLAALSVIAAPAFSHPDYLAYFNQLAGSNPETVLCESDLDWGQDLARLSARAQALGIRRLGIAYFGTAPLDRAGLPAYYELSPNEPSGGYCAISVRHLRLTYAKDGSFGWLKRYSPIEKIGKSIYLFRVPEREAR